MKGFIAAIAVLASASASAFAQDRTCNKVIMPDGSIRVLCGSAESSWGDHDSRTDINRWYNDAIRQYQPYPQAPLGQADEWTPYDSPQRRPQIDMGR